MSKTFVIIIAVACGVAVAAALLSYFVERPVQAYIAPQCRAGYTGSVKCTISDQVCHGTNQTDGVSPEDRLANQRVHGWPATYYGIIDVPCPINADPQFKILSFLADVGVYFLPAIGLVSVMKLARGLK